MASKQRTIEKINKKHKQSIVQIEGKIQSNEQQLEQIKIQIDSLVRLDNQLTVDNLDPIQFISLISKVEEKYKPLTRNDQSSFDNSSEDSMNTNEFTSSDYHDSYSEQSFNSESEFL